MHTRTFALVLALVFIALGIAGFVPALAHPAGEVTIAADANANVAAAVPGDPFGPGDAMLFGWFPVNVSHNVLHMLTGLWGLVAARSTNGARTYARGVAILYLLLAAAGLVPATQTGFGLIPLYAKSVWLHGLAALAAAYFGWVNRNAPA